MPPSGRAPTQHLKKMMNGESPTAPEFDCPECGGVVHMSASPHRNNKLSVSMKCMCTETELDGVPKWPGWEALARVKS